MCISNLAKAEISFNHKERIQNLFRRHVKGALGIDHFSLNIFFGDSESIFLSPTPQMAEELCKKDFIKQDSNYKAEVYKNFTLYPWRSVQRHHTDVAINLLKEEKFGMRSGMMMVRDLGQGRYVMYSFATHRQDQVDFPGQFYFLFHCKANYIAQMGDFLYNNLLPVINEYTEQEDVTMPKIDEFRPLNLEQSFTSEEQFEMFDTIKNKTNIDLLNLLKVRKAPILKLINGGKIRSS